MALPLLRSAAAPARRPSRDRPETTASRNSSVWVRARPLAVRSGRPAPRPSCSFGRVDGRRGAAVVLWRVDHQRSPGSRQRAVLRRRAASRCAVADRQLAAPGCRRRVSSHRRRRSPAGAAERRQRQHRAAIRRALIRPMTMPAMHARRTAPESEGTVPSLPRRALLVEPELAVRQLLRTHLELAGFHLEEIADGRAALDRLRSVAYDVIILDALVPSLDGVTLCRAARAGGPNGHAGIVMLSARNTESERVLGLSSGADDYMTKPFGIRELLARIAAILRRAERGRRGIAGGATPRRAAVARPGAAAGLRSRPSRRSHAPGVRRPPPALRPPRHRPQPRRPARACVEPRFARQPPHRGRRHQPAAAQDRVQSPQPAADPYRVGGRIQVLRNRRAGELENR